MNLDNNIVKNLFFSVAEACKNKECELLYALVSGSHCYGIATENSDIDIRFVFAGSEKHYLGFSNIDHITIGSEDIFGYELKKYAKLAAAGNPSVLETLFVDSKNVLYVHDFFKPFLENRKEFLSQLCYNPYVQYAKNQIKKATLTTPEIIEQLEDYENRIKVNNVSFPIGSISQKTRDLVDITNKDYTIGKLVDEYTKFKQSKFPFSDLGNKRKQLVKKYGYDTKNYSHAIRLLSNCLEIFTLNTINVDRKEQGQYLLDIKNGKYDSEILFTEASKIIEEIDKAVKTTKLEKEVDYKLVEQLTINCLKNIL